MEDDQNENTESPKFILFGTHEGFYEQAYSLIRGLPIPFCISLGSSARFHTPRIHLELTYERAYSLASGTSSTGFLASGDADVTLDIEWVDVDDPRSP